MKKIIFVSIVILLNSCNEQIKTYSLHDIQQGVVIDRPGYYHLPSTNLKVMELKNETIIYGVSDKKGKCLFQSNLFTAFNNNQFWRIYIDRNENFWIYSSDFPELNVWKKEDDIYKQYNYCIEEVDGKDVFFSAIKKCVCR